MPEDRPDGLEQKIFVSYSRADAGFAGELLAGLRFKGGYVVAMDTHSIAEGEDWKSRLYGLIAECDTVVFLLSPDSAVSEMCTWEVSTATKLSKRIIPILVRPLGDASAPKALARLNYIRFDEGRSLIAGLEGLTRALDTNLYWLREHTRLLSRAMEWDGADRPGNRLLTGTDISDAKAWRERRPQQAPAPTDLHLAFIQESEVAEARRADARRKEIEAIEAAQTAKAEALSLREEATQQLSRRTAAGLVGAGTLTALAGGLAVWGTSAEKRFQQEQQRRANAEERSVEVAARTEANRDDIRGTLLAFATADSDNAVLGQNNGVSPYTQAVLDELQDPLTSFQDALLAANRQMMEREEQRPYFSTDLSGDLYSQLKPEGQVRKAITISVNNVAGQTHSEIDLDGRAWNKFVESAGFESAHLENPSRISMVQALNELNSDPALGAISGIARPTAFTPSVSQQIGLGLFYFSGMGLSHNGRRFLVTSETNFSSGTMAKGTAMDLEQVTRLMTLSCRAWIVILDTQFVDIEYFDDPSRL